MLILVRPTAPPDRDTQVAVAVLRWWQRFEWDEFLLWACVGFHLVIAATLAAAPYSQVLTPGTRPVLELASRYLWAAAFAAVGVAVLTLARSGRPGLRLATWSAVLLLGGWWGISFAVNVFGGGGSAIGLVVWVFLYLIWTVLAFRLGLGKR